MRGPSSLSSPAAQIPPISPLYNRLPISHNTNMKKSLAHLPKLKQDELKLIVDKIDSIAEPEKIILFGSYARGDWKDGPHIQGKGRLTIHKKSDYDIFVITDDTGKATFSGKVNCRRSGRFGFTVRAIPKHPDFANMHDMGLILWESTHKKGGK